MSGFDVYEKGTRHGYSLHINLRDPANSVIILPFSAGAGHKIDEIAKLTQEAEAVGYSCNTNFKSERLVCVR